MFGKTMFISSTLSNSNSLLTWITPVRQRTFSSDRGGQISNPKSAESFVFVWTEKFNWRPAAIDPLISSGSRAMEEKNCGFYGFTRLWNYVVEWTASESSGCVKVSIYFSNLLVHCWQLSVLLFSGPAELATVGRRNETNRNIATDCTRVSVWLANWQRRSQDQRDQRGE